MKDESNESGAILQSVLDGLGEIIVFALNRDYRYTAFNENHRREMKAVWNAEIELGTNLLECMADPGLRAKAKASLDRAFRGESFVEVQHQPGLDVYYEIQWRPQRSPAGDTMGVIALIRDITSHQRAENALSESEANFRTVFEGASTGMSLTAPDGRLMRVNQAFADMLGHSIAEMQSLDFAAITHPDDLAESRECVRSLLADERTTYRMDKRYLHRGGYFVWATVSTMLYRDASGKPVHFITDILDISDRKKAQEALREAHDQLEARVRERTADLIRNKQLLDNTGKLAKVGGWEIDLKTGKNIWSATTRIIHEVEPGFDPNLDKAINFYAPESIPIITSLVDRLISLGEPFDAELELITAKKNRIWVRALGQAYRENGKIVRIGGAFQDINERKRTEIELKQYRDHLQELVSERTAELVKSRELLVEAQAVARLGSWELDVVRDEIAGSEEFYRLFGVKPENLTHFHQFVALLHGDDREHVLRAVTDALHHHMAYDTDYRVLGPDGSWRSINARGRVFLDEQGAPLRFVGTCMDITERKRSENELLIKNQVFDKAIVAQSITDDKANLIHANSEFVRMWGFESKEEVIGKNVAEFLADPVEKLRIIEVLKEQGAWEGEFLAKRRDGKTFITRGFIASLFNDRSAFIGYQSTNLDMTKDRETEARLKAATVELARSNKELELFAYVASHDLQEPLRMVSSYTQLLAQRYEGQLDEKAKKYIDYAVDGAVRMQRLINDLLTYSRISTRGQSPQPTDARTVLGGALQNLQSAIEENGAIVTNDDLPTVRVDASQLMQVFQNLIANAIKFRGETPPRIHVSAKEQRGEWLFSVRDKGIGIDPQFADKLFVIFRRLHTRQEYPGTGIGLAVCKRIVERHGGRIWFESELGKGTTFFFTVSK